MKIINPNTIDDTTLIASTVLETDYPEWASGTAYAIGDRVIRAALHKAYEAVAASTGAVPQTSPTVWLDLGATNRWACFDQKIGTVTQQQGGFSMSFRFALATGIALMAVNAGYAHITMTDATAGVVYDQTIPLVDNTEVTDWYAYFYTPAKRKDALVLTDLPSYRSASLTVELIDDAASMASLGALIVGQATQIGRSVEYGASSKIIDYSRKDFDAFGNVTIIQRAFSKRVQMDVWVRAADVDYVQALIARLRATPIVFIGTADYAALIVYGFYKSFDITIRYPTYAVCSLEIEGLT
jgi:hypothetical protein